MIVGRDARQRVRSDGGLLRAADLIVIIEIVSSGSRRIDRIVKRAEYADAGIDHYWIVDIDAQATLTAHRLAGTDYRVEAPATGRYTADAPFGVDLDLAGF